MIALIAESLDLKPIAAGKRQSKLHGSLESILHIVAGCPVISAVCYYLVSKE